jgi:hypothetical protein
LSLLAAVGDAAHALPPSGVALLDVDMHECSPAPLLPPPSPSGVMALKMGTAASLAGPAQPLPTAGAPRAQQREPAVAKPPQPQQLEQRQPHVPPHLQQAPPQQQAAPPPQLQPQPQQQPQQRPPAPALPLPLQQQLPGGVGGVAGGLVVGGAVPEGLSRLDREAALTMLHFIGKYKEADPFRVPVDVVALDIPDYNDVITTPMDLRTVRDKVCARAQRAGVGPRGGRGRGGAGGPCGCSRRQQPRRRRMHSGSSASCHSTRQNAHTRRPEAA